jgi:hypothetical protein
MSRDPVTVEAVADAKRRLDIHSVPLGKPAESGYAQRLARNICDESAWCVRDDSETDAINGNTRTDADLAEIECIALHSEPAIAADVAAFDDSSDILDDSRKHNAPRL